MLRRHTPFPSWSLYGDCIKRTPVIWDLSIKVPSWVTYGSFNCNLKYPLLISKVKRFPHRDKIPVILLKHAYPALDGFLWQVTLLTVAGQEGGDLFSEQRRLGVHFSDVLCRDSELLVDGNHSVLLEPQLILCRLQRFLTSVESFSH